MGAALDQVRRESGGGPTLIIAPLSGTINTWRKHYKREFPKLRGAVLNPKSRKPFLDALSRPLGTYDYYVVHWDSLRYLTKDLQKIRWNHIIADEVHRAKNRKAQTTVALKKLRTNYKTGLSGTPVTNRPEDFWSILNWLYPREFGSYWNYYKKYVTYDIVYPQGFHKNIRPNPDTLPELLETLEPFYVRHLKKEPCCPHHPQGVMPWLPDKTYADPIWVDLTPKQRRAYDQMRKDMLAWVGSQGDKPLVAPVVISRLVRLQQLALAHADIDDDGRIHLVDPSSKLDALMEIIKDNPDEQIVVFSQFSQPIFLLEQRLIKAGISAAIFTGQTSHSRRTELVNQFQEGKLRVFAGTIKAGGVGLDLYNSSTVVFLDRAWSPSENLQAEDRLWRHGQKNAVEVIDIMARNTVDLGRKQAIDLKWDNIRTLLGDK